MANINDAYGVIEQVNTSGNKYNIASTSCAYCETPAGTADKVAALAGFKYIPGVTVRVYFKYANTASNPTLNVNNEQAYPIMLYGTQNAGADSETTGWQAGAVVSFTYVEVDSTHKYWYRDQGYNTNTTYDTLTQTLVNTGTETTGKLVTAKIIKDTVTNAINALDVDNATSGNNSHITGFSAAKTLATLIQTDGKISATFQDIAIAASQITSGTLSVSRGGIGTGTLTSGEVLIGNGTNAVSTLAIDSTVTANSTHLITSGAVATAIGGLTGAMHLLGVTTTDVSTGTANTTATVSIDSSNVTAINGDVVLYGAKEYVWANNKWNLLGDEGSYALDESVVHKSDYNAKGAILKGTGSGAYDALAPNTQATGKVLYMASSTASWKQLGINTTNHTAKAVTNVAYTANTGGWSTLNKGSGVSITGIDEVGTPASASVTNAILTITNGTAPTKATAQTVPKLSDLSLSDGTWPTLNVTKTTDFLTGAEISYT